MTIRLGNESIRLWLQPRNGVEWQALQVRRGDDWLTLTPDCRDERACSEAGSGKAPGTLPSARSELPAACFVMIPYSNRLRDGAFAFDGQSHQLGRPEKHAIHGALRTLPWQVETLSDIRALCRFDSRPDAGPGSTGASARPDWPWPIEATLDHALTDTRLTSEIALTNHGDTPMPAGFGWHPYFVRELGGGGPVLQVPVASVYPDGNGDGLPDGAPVDLPAELDFRKPRTLPPDQRIDRCFGGLSGRVQVSWPSAGVGMSVQASPVCSHLVLFNPDAPHFALEPVVNANDGFNLRAQGIDAGVQVLEPGDTLRATMTLQFDIDAD